jgi:hypothetical protein
MVAASTMIVELVFTTLEVCQILLFTGQLMLYCEENCPTSDSPIGIASVEVAYNLHKGHD